MSTSPAVWVSALLTLVVYSFLIKDNKAFGLVERLFVGVGSGFFAGLGYRNIVLMGIMPVMEGSLSRLIPLLLGLMVYARYFKPIAWVAKIPLGIVVAAGAALALRGTVGALFLNQIAGTMLPLTSINNAIIVVGTITTVAYFHFRARPLGPFDTVMNWSSTFARAIMMVAFGVGYTAILGANIPRTIGQLQLIFGSWIHLIPGF